MNQSALFAPLTAQQIKALIALVVAAMLRAWPDARRDVDEVESEANEHVLPWHAAWQRMRMCDPNSTVTLESYVWICARNRAGALAKRWRLASGGTHSVSDAVADAKQRDPSEAATSVETVGTVRTAMERILSEVSDEMRPVLRAVINDRLSYREAIQRERVAIAEPAVRKAMQRFRERLWQELGEEYLASLGYGRKP
jgi:DNA-directed RNA polymerase specialized sigma24 family protein